MGALVEKLTEWGLGGISEKLQQYGLQSLDDLRDLDTYGEDPKDLLQKPYPDGAGLKPLQVRKLLQRRKEYLPELMKSKT